MMSMYRFHPVLSELNPGHTNEGISSETMALLRTRKEAYKNQSGEGTWRDIYRLLFPDAADVPSSYKLKERSHIEVLVHRSGGSKRKTQTKLDRVTAFDSGNIHQHLIQRVFQAWRIICGARFRV